MIDLKNFIEQANKLIFYLDDNGGKKLIKEIGKEEMLFIEREPDLKSAFIALKFLVIPFLSTVEIADLLANNLLVGLRLDDMDIQERMRQKLIFLHMVDRDNCKKILKEALIKNQEIITRGIFNENKTKLTTLNDWLKDYISHTSLRRQTLERAQYFFQRTYFTKLAESDKKILSKFFSLYDFLSASSFTREGFEDDLLFKDKDGRLLTTSKGKVVVLYDPRRSVKKEKTKIPEVKPAKKIVDEKNNQLEELKQLAARYPAGSLPRKAVEEEIGKLNDKFPMTNDKK